MTDDAADEVDRETRRLRRYYGSLDPADALDALCVRLALAMLLNSQLSTRLAAERAETSAIEARVRAELAEQIAAITKERDDLKALIARADLLGIPVAMAGWTGEQMAVHEAVNASLPPLEDLDVAAGSSPDTTPEPCRSPFCSVAPGTHPRQPGCPGDTTPEPKP